MKVKGNGLVELVDEKSDVGGFFCMKLAGYILEERKTLKEGAADIYDKRFEQAKAGNCAYKGRCPIYERTKAKKKGIPVQLSFDF